MKINFKILLGLISLFFTGFSVTFSYEINMCEQSYGTVSCGNAAIGDLYEALYSTPVGNCSNSSRPAWTDQVDSSCSIVDTIYNLNNNLSKFRSGIISCIADKYKDGSLSGQDLVDMLQKIRGIGVSKLAGGTEELFLTGKVYQASEFLIAMNDFLSGGVFGSIVNNSAFTVDSVYSFIKYVTTNYESTTLNNPNPYNPLSPLKARLDSLKNMDSGKISSALDKNYNEFYSTLPELSFGDSSFTKSNVDGWGNKFMNNTDDEVLGDVFNNIASESGANVLWKVGRVCVGGNIVDGLNALNYSGDPIGRLPCMNWEEFTNYSGKTNESEKVKELFLRDDVYLYTYLNGSNQNSIIGPIQNYLWHYRTALLRGLKDFGGTWTTAAKFIERALLNNKIDKKLLVAAFGYLDWDYMRANGYTSMDSNRDVAGSEEIAGLCQALAGPTIVKLYYTFDEINGDINYGGFTDMYERRAICISRSGKNIYVGGELLSPEYLLSLTDNDAKNVLCSTGVAVMSAVNYMEYFVNTGNVFASAKYLGLMSSGCIDKAASVVDMMQISKSSVSFNSTGISVSDAGKIFNNTNLTLNTGVNLIEALSGLSYSRLFSIMMSSTLNTSRLADYLADNTLDIGLSTGLIIDMIDSSTARAPSTLTGIVSLNETKYSAVIWGKQIFRELLLVSPYIAHTVFGSLIDKNISLSVDTVKEVAKLDNFDSIVVENYSDIINTTNTYTQKLFTYATGTLDINKAKTLLLALNTWVTNINTGTIERNIIQSINDPYLQEVISLMEVATGSNLLTSVGRLCVGGTFTTQGTTPFDYTGDPLSRAPCTHEQIEEYTGSTYHNNVLKSIFERNDIYLYTYKQGTAEQEIVGPINNYVWHYKTSVIRGIAESASGWLNAATFIDWAVGNGLIDKKLIVAAFGYLDWDYMTTNGKLQLDSTDENQVTEIAQLCSALSGDTIARIYRTFEEVNGNPSYGNFQDLLLRRAICINRSGKSTYVENAIPVVGDILSISDYLKNQTDNYVASFLCSTGFSVQSGSELLTFYYNTGNIVAGSKMLNTMGSGCIDKASNIANITNRSIIANTFAYTGTTSNTIAKILNNSNLGIYTGSQVIEIMSGVNFSQITGALMNSNLISSRIATYFSYTGFNTLLSPSLEKSIIDSNLGKAQDILRLMISYNVLSGIELTKNLAKLDGLQGIVVEETVNKINNPLGYISNLFAGGTGLDRVAGATILNSMGSGGFLSTGTLERNIIQVIDDSYMQEIVDAGGTITGGRIMENVGRICIGGVTGYGSGVSITGYVGDPAGRSPCISYDEIENYSGTTQNNTKLKEVYERNDVYLYTYSGEDGIGLRGPLDNYPWHYKTSVIRGLAYGSTGWTAAAQFMDWAVLNSGVDKRLIAAGFGYLDWDYIRNLGRLSLIGTDAPNVTEIAELCTLLSGETIVQLFDTFDQISGNVSYGNFSDMPSRRAICMERSGKWDYFAYRMLSTGYLLTQTDTIATNILCGTGLSQMSDNTVKTYMEWYADNAYKNDALKYMRLMSNSCIDKAARVNNLIRNSLRVDIVKNNVDTSTTVGQNLFAKMINYNVDTGVETIKEIANQDGLSGLVVEERVDIINAGTGYVNKLLTGSFDNTQAGNLFLRLANLSQSTSEKVGYFDGNGDYLSVNDSDDWYFGSSDFTIDFWIKPASVSSVPRIISQKVDGDNQWSLNLRDGKIEFYNQVGGVANIEVYSPVLSWDLSKWYHIALVRNGNNFSFYRNGESVYSLNSSDSVSDFTAALQIGAFGGVAILSGYLDELRVSKGIARWTSNFTPSTIPYSSDSYTKLLLHFNGNGNNFVDSATSKTITANGDATQTGSNTIFSDNSSNLAVGLIERNIIQAIDDGYMLSVASTLGDTTGTSLLTTVGRICLFGEGEGTSSTSFNDDPGARTPCTTPYDRGDEYDFSPTQRQAIQSLYDREDVYLYSYKQGTSRSQLVGPLSNYKWHYKTAVWRGLGWTNAADYIDWAINQTGVNVNKLAAGFGYLDWDYMRSLGKTQLDSTDENAVTEIAELCTALSGDTIIKLYHILVSINGDSTYGGFPDLITRGAFCINRSGKRSYIENNLNVTLATYLAQQTDSYVASYLCGTGFSNGSGKDLLEYYVNTGDVVAGSKMLNVMSSGCIDKAAGVVNITDKNIVNTVFAYTGANVSTVAKILNNSNLGLSTGSDLIALLSGTNYNKLSSGLADSNLANSRLAEFISSVYFNYGLGISIEKSLIDNNLYKAQDVMRLMTTYNTLSGSNIISQLGVIDGLSGVIVEETVGYINNFSTGYIPRLFVGGTGLDTLSASTLLYKLSNPTDGDEKVVSFDGNGDYLSVSSSSDFEFGSGDFTIDFWINPSLIHNDNDIIGFGTSVFTDSRIVFSTDNKLRFFDNNDANCQVKDLTSSPINTWTHFAISRNGSNLYLFRNGTLVSAQTSCTSSQGANSELILGRRIDGGTSFSGYLDEVRVSKGIARWTSNFIPSTTPYISDSYTKLLLHFNGISNSFIDSAMAKIVTANGNTTQILHNIRPASILSLGNVNRNIAQVIDDEYMQKVIDAGGTITGGKILESVGRICMGGYGSFGSGSFMTGYSGDGSSRTPCISYDEVELYSGTAQNNTKLKEIYERNDVYMYSYSGSDSMTFDNILVGPIDNYKWHYRSAVIRGLANGSSGWNAAAGFMDWAQLNTGIDSKLVAAGFGYLDWDYMRYNGYSTLDANRDGANVSELASLCQALSGETIVQLFNTFDQINGSGNYGYISDFPARRAICMERSGKWDYFAYRMLSTGYLLTQTDTIATNILCGTGLSQMSDSTVKTYMEWYADNAYKNDALKYMRLMSNNCIDKAARVNNLIRNSLRVDIVKNNVDTSTTVGQNLFAKMINYNVDTGVETIKEIANQDGLSGLVVEERVDIINAATGYVNKLLTGSFQQTAASTLFSKLTNNDNLGNVGYFDGNGDYLSLSDNTDWNFGNGNFTIDYWIYPTNVSVVNQMLVGQVEISNYASFRTEISNGSIGILLSTSSTSWDGNCYTNSILSNNNWYHLSFVRSGSEIYIFVNGIKEKTCSFNGTLYDSNRPLSIVSNGAGGYFYSGYIDELRISKGIARWTSNFIPTKSPYLADGYDKLLIHFDGSSNSFIDSATSKTITANGNSTQVTTPTVSSLNGIVGSLGAIERNIINSLSDNYLTGIYYNVNSSFASSVMNSVGRLCINGNVSEGSSMNITGYTGIPGTRVPCFAMNSTLSGYNGTLLYNQNIKAYYERNDVQSYVYLTGTTKTKLLGLMNSYKWNYKTTLLRGLGWTGAANFFNWYVDQPGVDPRDLAAAFGYLDITYLRNNNKSQLDSTDENTIPEVAAFCQVLSGDTIIKLYNAFELIKGDVNYGNFPDILLRRAICVNRSGKQTAIQNAIYGNSSIPTLAKDLDTQTDSYATTVLCGTGISVLSGRDLLDYYISTGNVSAASRMVGIMADGCNYKGSSVVDILTTVNATSIFDNVSLSQIRAAKILNNTGLSLSTGIDLIESLSGTNFNRAYSILTDLTISNSRLGDYLGSSSFDLGLAVKIMSDYLQLNNYRVQLLVGYMITNYQSRMLDILRQIGINDGLGNNFVVEENPSYINSWSGNLNKIFMGGTGELDWNVAGNILLSMAGNGQYISTGNIDRNIINTIDDQYMIKVLNNLSNTASGAAILDSVGRICISGNEGEGTLPTNYNGDAMARIPCATFDEVLAYSGVSYQNTKVKSLYERNDLYLYTYETGNPNFNIVGPLYNYTWQSRTAIIRGLSEGLSGWNAAAGFMDWAILNSGVDKKLITASFGYLDWDYMRNNGKVQLVSSDAPSVTEIANLCTALSGETIVQLFDTFDQISGDSSYGNFIDMPARRAICMERSGKWDYFAYRMNSTGYLLTQTDTIATNILCGTGLSQMSDSTVKTYMEWYYNNGYSSDALKYMRFMTNSCIDKAARVNNLITANIRTDILKDNLLTNSIAKAQSLYTKMYTDNVNNSLQALRLLAVQDGLSGVVVETNTNLINNFSGYVYSLFAGGTGLDNTIGASIFASMSSGTFLPVGNLDRNILQVIDDEYMDLITFAGGDLTGGKILENIGRICIGGFNGFGSGTSLTGYIGDPAGRYPCVSYNEILNYSGSSQNNTKVKEIYERNDVYLYTFSGDEQKVMGPVDNYLWHYRTSVLRGITHSVMGWSGVASFMDWAVLSSGVDKKLIAAGFGYLDWDYMRYNGKLTLSTSDKDSIEEIGELCKALSGNTIVNLYYTFDQINSNSTYGGFTDMISRKDICVHKSGKVKDVIQGLAASGDVTEAARLMEMYIDVNSQLTFTNNIVTGVVYINTGVSVDIFNNLSTQAHRVAFVRSLEDPHGYLQSQALKPTFCDALLGHLTSGGQGDIDVPNGVRATTDEYNAWCY